MEIKVLAGCILLLWAVEDIRNKSIPIYWMVAGGVLLIGGGVYTGVWKGEDMVLRLLAGLLPGLFLLLLSFTSNGAVGSADGFAMLLLGGVFGVWTGISILFTGLCMFCVVSVILLWMKRINKKTKLPFLPFLLCGYFMCYVMGGIGI